MIEAKFFSENNRLIGFCIGGHAGFADFGKDIACASVSSAIQLTANSITECFAIKANLKVSEDNSVTLMLTDKDMNNIAVGEKLIDSLKLHLELLNEEFPKTIKIKFTEV